MKTNYQIDGAGPRWVTFVTGIANDISLWDGQVPALARGFKVLRYDLRGHGGTESTPGDYTIDILVRDLRTLLDQLRIQTTSLVGLGLGGALVQAFAIQHPERVERLMPCCCRAQMVPDFAAMWHKLRDTVRQNGLESIVEPTVQRWFSADFKAAHPEVLDKTRKMIRGTTQQGYLGITGAFLGLALEDQLGRIKAPTLYVSGADDH
ncbi:MAG TPA: alpha/beta fold hydrolase, partial [Burkholderiales bacterium]|nr:alpha/beta fold hydrolase [Burkholderiales bacterium]